MRSAKSGVYCTWHFSLFRRLRVAVFPLFSSRWTWSTSFLFSLTCTAGTSRISVRLSPWLWENALYSLWKWTFPLWPSYLSLRAPLPWFGSGGLCFTCVFPVLPSCNRKLLAGLLCLHWLSYLYHLHWDEWEGASRFAELWFCFS